MSNIATLWHDAAAWLSRDVVGPVLSTLHVGSAAGDPHEIAEAVLIAAIQLCVIALVLRPLESLAPAERWAQRHGTRVDRQYTLLMVLGILPLFSYLVLTPVSHFLGGAPAGAEPIAGLKHWLPWLEQHPVLLFVCYYVVYDGVYYFMHRLQHAVPWWWALHSLHHSQRQVSCWTNDRGSYLDSILQSMVLASVGLAMGVEPSEFALLMLVGELMQNLSHANVRIRFGPVLEKVFVGPLFHRLHHMRADPARPGFHNCNFGQVLPVWDILFSTALYGEPARPTGVCDPIVDADNDRGLAAQQWMTLKRFRGAVTRRSGWKLGDVSFGPDYRPVPSIHHEVGRSADLPPRREATIVLPGPDVRR
jgi:sterol desaturase/sphingolipid hydroxylase (fatty acid hydroxylase superfamily)